MENPFLHGYSTNNILILIFRKFFAPLFFKKVESFFAYFFLEKSKLADQFELISYAPDGFEHPFVRNALEFFTQTLNVNVNRS